MSSQREIKVGDWVTCLKSSCDGCFTEGKNYQVTAVIYDSGDGSLEMIDDEDDHNGWSAENFIKAAYQGTPPDYEGIIQSMNNMIAETEEIYRKLIECQKILDS
ncbi:hypothetical protein [Marinicella marina]|uniref:hypothetical protein n=1 Tax=Marinicella marina TaxID=2996016 RepID=UPI0024BC2D05|nr:hypothetical protein [Marinicella marina]MDJ1139651.1 hypothetical protein [Marinicella marina]